MPDLPGYQVRKCEQPDCGLRYPLPLPASRERCPRCGGSTRLVLFQPRHGDLPVKDVSSTVASGLRLEALLDNIRSAWNVGSIFRSADGAGFSRLYLCGITPTPECDGVHKTALGAEQSVPWEQHLDGVAASDLLLEAGVRLWALETEAGALNLYQARIPPEATRVVLVVGNELCGVDPGILERCEQRLYIPMQGVKRSYNVAVAFGIAAHYLAHLAAPA